MLKVSGVDTFYGRIRALRSVSLSVTAGQIVALLGANGAGKTTTLKTIAGLLRPAAGEVIFHGHRVHGRDPAEIVRLGLSLVPEGRQVFPEMSVIENLQMGAYVRKDAGAVKQDLEKTFQYFPSLKTRQNRPAGLLSGGEQQMLAIGRAMMARPKMMMLDEPSLGLAPMIVEGIFDIIRRIHRQGKPVLLVEQNAVMALSTAHYCYVLETGRVAIHGSPEDLAGKSELMKSYLGDETG